MRHARLTWQGAFHHVMNRGHNKEAIFSAEDLKKQYLQILAEYSLLYKIKIFGFCIMDNHFHMILQNYSGRLSEFMKQKSACLFTYYVLERLNCQFTTCNYSFGIYFQLVCSNSGLMGNWYGIWIVPFSM